MKFTIPREKLFAPVQTVNGVVERRQTLPILSNLLLVAQDNALSLTATDMEVELVATVEHPVASPGEITVPARKLLDICRALPDEATVAFEVVTGRAVIQSGKSRFTLATLPAEEFPATEVQEPIVHFTIAQNVLKELISSTHFAMAHQDVRYFLNGLMLEISSGQVRGVATDGHRLALCDMPVGVDVGEALQVIVPRKGVLELARLLDDRDTEVAVAVGRNHIQITFAELRYTAKLIDGRFPDYQRVLPALQDEVLMGDRTVLRQGLTRASILSNEKYRGIRLLLQANSMRALAHNPEQEEAEEEIEVEYGGEEMEIGFNVSYLLDALAAIKTAKVRLSVSDPNSSCLILPEDSISCQYVVMPMRL